jgi:hypothetical protein
MEKNKIESKTVTLSEGNDYIVDNRIRFKDGKLYITETPYKGGEQSNFPEEIDVTEEVAKAIAKYIKDK